MRRNNNSVALSKRLWTSVYTDFYHGRTCVIFLLVHTVTETKNAINIG